jgi:hypothetical protein
MARLVQLLFYQGDADCFFIVQSRCSLGLQVRFGIIAAPCCWVCIRPGKQPCRAIIHVVITHRAGTGPG